LAISAVGCDDVSGLAGEKLHMSRTLLFVVNVDWFFLSHRLPIALEAKRQGYKVHIATRVTDKLDELLHHGLVVHPLEIDRSSAGVCNAWRMMLDLWRLFRAVRPDLVHLVTIKPVLLGGIMARLAGVPAMVAAISGLGFVFVAQGVKAKGRRLLVGLLYRLALGHGNMNVIFQNPNDRDTLIAATDLIESKVAMIYGSGVDLDQYIQCSPPTNERIVLLAARLLINKGVLDFVEAARMLRRRFISSNTVVRFVLVGKQDMDNPTSLSSAQLKAWVDEGAIEYWGHRSDMPEVLSAANIVVLPSYYGEGLPKVLIEAAACGRTVVTTDHPGCRDAIEPGVTGVLIPVRNAYALADAIQDLLEHPDKCAAMGRAGRELAERVFDVQHVVAAHLQIYDKLLTKVAR
jgi:glycosyltransferase involved in cell wall biosynthesis